MIETTIGDITVDLLIQDRPRTCFNFLKLCKMKYYNYCLFHHVEKDFIAQTGDPTGTGTGGHCVYHEISSENGKFLESEKLPKIRHTRNGTVSMVNNGDNLHGSQFFITLSEDLDCLDDNHTVFGYVAEGFDVLDQLNLTICNDSKRPYKDIFITHTVILDDPFPDPIQMPDTSPPPPDYILNSEGIGIGEDLDDNEGKTLEEIEEDIKEKEARAQATILEMVGDLPDSDIKPPENVLFVCKLNPVTKEEDLEIIFSRFGPIVSCEIIRDQKSGESLQYAFIEFQNVEGCEKAYFKMDNVLIDDRRIHVDFSQSVSKLKWEARRKVMRNVATTKSSSSHSRLDHHREHHRHYSQSHHDHKSSSSASSLHHTERSRKSSRDDHNCEENRKRKRDRDEKRRKRSKSRSRSRSRKERYKSERWSNENRNEKRKYKEERYESYRRRRRR